MKKATFDKKAHEMGDFYMYYSNEDGKVVFAVGTTDMSTPHIKNHRRMKNLPEYNPFTHVRIWNWKADRPLTVALECVKKLVPLGTVLRNNNVG